MLRIASSPSDNGSCVPLVRVDQRRKQVTLSEPKDKEDVSLRSLGLSSAPKLFAFDAIFESSATKVRFFINTLFQFQLNPQFELDRLHIWKKFITLIHCSIFHSVFFYKLLLFLFID